MVLAVPKCVCVLGGAVLCVLLTNRLKQNGGKLTVSYSCFINLYY